MDLSILSEFFKALLLIAVVAGVMNALFSSSGSGGDAKKPRDRRD